MGNDQYPENNGEQPNLVPNNFRENANVSVDAYAAPIETIPETPGYTPIMAGVSRTDMEHMAAEKATREAVAAAAEKKTHPMLVVGITCAIIAIAVVSTIVFISLTNKNDIPVATGNGDSNNNSEPEKEQQIETQKIGSEEHGYMFIPKEWNPTNVNSGDGSINYSDSEGKNKVTLNSAAISATMTAELFAKTRLANGTKLGGSSADMNAETIGEYEGYKIHYYIANSQTWVFEYVFEAQDGFVYYIHIETPDAAASYVNSIPESWKGARKKIVEEPEEPEEDAEEDSDEAEND